METESPLVDLNHSKEYDRDNEVASPADDGIQFTDSYTLNNFTVLDKIGKGAFGLVHEAIRIADEKKFALKFVQLSSKTDLAKTLREVQTIRSLNHKNVLKYHHHWFDELNISNYTSRSKSKALEEGSSSCSLNISFREEEEEKDCNINSNEINFATNCTTSNTYNSMSSNSEDDTSHTQSSTEEDSETSKIHTATNCTTSTGTNLKTSEEDDASNTASSTEEVYSTNERNNALRLSSSIINTSSEEEHFSSYLVIQSELCKKKNLKKLITSKRVIELSENERRKLFLGIVYGLQHIHDKRIIHRDLKPSNIFFGLDDQEVKIADFGLAREYKMSHADGNSTSTSKKDKDSLSSNIGTIPYVAPEVLESTFYGHKADLYSLGIILSEIYLDMDSGRPRIIDRLRNQDFRDLTNIPDEVVEVIKSLLSHEPSLRMELERVIDIMSPLKHHQRDGVEADQTEVFPDNDSKCVQGCSGNRPSTLQLYEPFYSVPTEESQPNQPHSEDSDILTGC